MERRSKEWKTWIAEPKFECEERFYSLEIGYMHYDDSDSSKNLYLRLWQGDEFLVGSWMEDFEFFDKDDRYMQSLPKPLVDKCVEVAHRIAKLTAFV